MDYNKYDDTSSSLREKAHEEDFERMKQKEDNNNDSSNTINSLSSMSGLRKMILRDMTFTNDVTTANCNDGNGGNNDGNGNENDGNEFFFFNSPLEWKTNVPLQVPMVYCDFTASHRPMKSIERYISETCLPFYGNTHTNTSVTGGQSSAFVSEARQIIAEVCNAKITGKASEDVVLFAGNGTTGAVRLLIDCLGLQHYNSNNNNNNNNKNDNNNKKEQKALIERLNEELRPLVLFMAGSVRPIRYCFFLY